MQKLSCKPAVFWAWNANIMEEGIESQLEEFAAKGIGGVFVHARAGLLIPYMGDRWMELFAHTVKVAKRLGIDVWIYDEDGWPSGFAGGRVMAANDEFKCRYLNAEVGKYGSLKAKGEPMLSYTFSDGKFTLCDKSEGEYFIFCTVNDYYVDVTNAEAIDCFIECTHEKYKKVCKEELGKTVKGIFTDEPHTPPQGLPWGKYIESDFAKDYGYDVREAIPYLFFDMGDFRPHRYRFWKLINKLFTQNYADKYAEWCEKNGLFMTGHYACEEGLVEQITTGGGVMPLYENMGVIGVDALGNRLVPPAVFKQAESVSCQIGNGRILSEAFAGTGYDATFEELLWIWGYQAAMGVNLPCLSISMYSLLGNRKRDYPQFFSRQMPWWNNADKLFNRIEYINERLLEGTRPSDVLVIHPKTSVWLESGYQSNKKAMDVSAQFRLLTEALNDLGIDFDYGDEDLIKKHGSVDKNAFNVGKRRYFAIILPEMTNICFSTLRLIREFAANGGTVYVTNSYPEYLDGVKAENIIDFENVFVVNRREFWNKVFRMRGDRDVQLLQPSTRNAVCGIVSAVRYNERGTDVFTVNRQRDESISFRIRVKGKRVIAKEGLYGEKTQLLTTYNEAEDATYALTELAPKEVCFYAVSDGEIALDRLLPSSVTYLSPTVQRGENTFTVDTLSYSLDGEPFSEEDYFVNATNAMYERVNAAVGSHELAVKYTFLARGKIGKICVCCEISGGKCKINGEEVSPCGYFLDEGILRFDITDRIVEGQNVVVLEKHLSEYRNELLGKDVFQSISNVFSFPYYMESIYLVGDFDVEAKSFKHGDNCRWASGFTLTEKTAEADIEDLTSCKMPFFAGSVTATASFDANGGEYVLAWDKLSATHASVELGGEVFDLYGGSVNLTKAVKKGTNELKFTLTSGLRNLFGAHHHKYGKHFYTGPSVFEGYCEWQDVVINPELSGSSFVPEYSFVSFGIEGLRIEVKKQKER